MKPKQQSEVIKYGILVVGEIYQIVPDHIHSNKKIIIEDISQEDIIMGSGGNRYRNIHARILNSSVRINLIPNQIKEYYDKLISNIDYQKLSNLDIISMTKKGNKSALREFVRRFKKMPNIKRK